MPSYKIQSGDTLSGIARTKKTSVDELLKANPRIKNPDLIFAGNDLNLPYTESAGTVKPTSVGVTEPVGVNTQPEAKSGLEGVISDRAGAKSDRDTLLERLTSGISGVKDYDPVARRKTLEEERGLSEKRDQIGSYEQEIDKTMGLLDSLESDIKNRTGDFMINESQRNRVVAAESEPLSKQLGVAQRGLGLAESSLGREETEIDKILAGEKEQAYRPLELLQGELGVMETIDKLFPEQNTEQVSSIIGAIQSGGSEDPIDIYNSLREQGVDVGIEEITNTLKQIQSVRQEVQSDMDIADLEYKKAQTAKIYSDIKKLEEADDITQIDESELDTDSQSILAQTGLSIPAYSFLTTGVSALTRMSSEDRKAYMAEAENWANNNNLDISTFQSEFKAYNEVVQRNIKISALVGLAGEDIKLSLGMLEDLSTGEFGDVKMKNLVKLWAGEQVNDPVAMKYKFNLNDLRSAISGFFAVQQGRTQTLQSDMEDAKELINDGLATGSISGLIETIDQVAQRSVEIADQSVNLAQDAVWEMFGVQKPEEDSSENMGSKKLTSPDGKQFVNTADLTPEELQEAKSAGWK